MEAFFVKIYSRWRVRNVSVCLVFEKFNHWIVFYKTKKTTHQRFFPWHCFSLHFLLIFSSNRISNYMNSIFKYICVTTFIALHASSIYANEDIPTDNFLNKIISNTRADVSKGDLKTYNHPDRNLFILTGIFSSNGLIIHAVMAPLSGMLTFMQKILL